MAENGGEGRGFCAAGIIPALFMMVWMFVRHPSRIRDAYIEGMNSK
jgi:hypothetical protein